MLALLLDLFFRISDSGPRHHPIPLLPGPHPTQQSYHMICFELSSLAFEINVCREKYGTYTGLFTFIFQLSMDFIMAWQCYLNIYNQCHWMENTRYSNNSCPLISISDFWFGVHIFLNQVCLVFIFVWEPYITFNKECIKTLQQVFLVILISWLVTGCVECKC